MSFAGKGEWTDQDGVKTPYNIFMHKHCNDDKTKTISTAIDAEGKHMEWTLTIVPTAVESRYDVNNENGEKIGWGYCYAMLVSKVCHMELNPHDGVHIEKTIHKTNNRIHTIGSMVSSDQSITWSDALRNVSKDQQSTNDLDLFE